MWGDKQYIQDSIDAAFVDFGEEPPVVEVSVDSGAVYIALKSVSGELLSR